MRKQAKGCDRLSCPLPDLTLTRPLTPVYTRDGGRTRTCLSASLLCFVLTGSQPLSKESALHGRLCFWKLLSRTLLNAQLSWCFAVGGEEAWALCCCHGCHTARPDRLLPGGQGHPASPAPRAGTGGQGHSCSSLKPCTSLEGVWYLPLPLRPTSGEEDWGLTTTLQRTIGKLQTQRVFSLLPEQGQYELILESRKVSSKLSKRAKDERLTP